MSSSIVLKLLTVPMAFASLASCAVFDYVFDVTEFCKPGEIQVKFVEMATEIVRVKCMNEGQLDVLKQDSTIRVISVGPVTGNSNPSPNPSESIFQDAS